MRITSIIRDSRRQTVRWRDAKGNAGASHFPLGVGQDEILLTLRRGVGELTGEPSSAQVAPADVAPPPVPPAPNPFAEVDPESATPLPPPLPPPARSDGRITRWPLADLVARAAELGITLPPKTRRPAIIAAIKEKTACQP